MIVGVKAKGWRCVDERRVAVEGVEQCEPEEGKLECALHTLVSSGLDQS